MTGQPQKIAITILIVFVEAILMITPVFSNEAILH